jgi:F-type H+-transporting ATPase subunit b
MFDPKSLNIDPVAILINMLGFGLLLWVAVGLVFKPVGRVIDERKGDIDSTYETLDADRRKMEALRDDYQKRLADIEAQARERIQSAIKEAEGARDQILTQATERSRDLVARAEQEAERERQEAMITLKRQIIDLALGATVKVIGDGIDEARQRKLIDDFITSGGESAGPADAAATASPTTSSAAGDSATAAADKAAKPRRAAAAKPPTPGTEA